MDIYEHTINILTLSRLADIVKGNKSHQFVCGSDSIYFNSSGQPRKVSDDSAYTGFSSYASDIWTHKYYYNTTETTAIAALEGYANKESSVKIRRSKIVNGQTVYYYGYSWHFDEERNLLFNRFSSEDMENLSWYTLSDAI